MVGSARVQFKANTVSWLATRASTMGLSCLLRIARFDPAQEKKLLEQWDLDWTKCQGTGEIGSLYLGFVISKTSI